MDKNAEKKSQDVTKKWHEKSGKEKLFTILNNVEECISAVALTALLLLTCVNVIGRYVFSYSVPGVEELVTTCFTWATFLGASACYKRNMHYGIDMLVNVLPKPIQIWLMRATHLFLAVVLGYVTYLAYELTANVGLKVTAYYMFSYRYIDMAAVLGFGFMCIHSLRFFIKDFRHPDKVMEPLIAEADDSLNEGGDS